MKFHGTQYYLDGILYTEEVAAQDADDLARRLAERGLGEKLDGSRSRDAPATESVVRLFDEGKYVEAAHGACQMVRLQNDSRRALEALNDHGLVHMLIHMALYPDEPVVAGRRREVREKLADLEARIRPGLNT